MFANKGSDFRSAQVYSCFVLQSGVCCNNTYRGGYHYFLSSLYVFLTSSVLNSNLCFNNLYLGASIVLFHFNTVVVYTDILQFNESVSINTYWGAFTTLFYLLSILLHYYLIRFTASSVGFNSM